MANRYFSQFQGTMEKGVVWAFGSFTTDTSGNITSQTGKAATVAKTGTGQYTVTLADKYMSMLMPDAALSSATAQNLQVQFGAIDVVTAQTVVVSLLAGATPTNPSAVTTVYYHMALKNSSV